MISVYSVIRISNRIQVGSASGKTRRAGAPKNIARGKWRIILNRHMQRDRACVLVAVTSLHVLWGVSRLVGKPRSTAVVRRQSAHSILDVAQRTPPPGDACGSGGQPL